MINSYSPVSNDIRKYCDNTVKKSYETLVYERHSDVKKEVYVDVMHVNMKREGRDRKYDLSSREDETLKVG